MKITVLMTGAGAPGAFSIIKCLRANGEREIRIVGTDMNPNAGCRDMVDSFYVVPAATSDSFVGAILEVAEKEGVDVVLPIVTKELMPLSLGRHLFEEKGIKVAVIEPENLALINDKAALLRFCEDNDIPTPRFTVASTADDVERALDEFDCSKNPVYVKAALGNGSRGVRFIDPTKSKYDLFFNEKPNSACMTRDAIVEALRERDDIPVMLVMESLPGVEYSADLIAVKGKISCFAARRSPVVSSSITLESTVVDEPRIFETCRRIVELLNLDGNIGFDFKADSEGFPQILEINPRLTATVALNAAAGLNFPYLSLKHALGEKLPSVEPRYGVSVTRRYEERYRDESGNPINPFE